jgi:hypothetical protein
MVGPEGLEDESKLSSESELEGIRVVQCFGLFLFKATTIGLKLDFSKY